MGSQFVDFNADGHIDLLTATFDGSPHVSYGSKEGFTAPVRLTDGQGERIVISSFWNYDSEQHEDTGRSMPDGKAKSERCISAVAFDWDADGDFDLLLGSYENGRLYRQMNKGSNGKPKFTGQNIPVMAGAEAFALPAKMTAPRLVDWDADGDLDIVAGSFADTFSASGKGGGVYLALNTGESGSPKFGALRALITPTSKGGPELDGPDAGMYPDVVDYDGDGDLDLIVGAYSLWSPDAPALSDADQKHVTQLEQTVAQSREDLDAAQAAMLTEIEEATDDLDPESEEYGIKSGVIIERCKANMDLLRETWSTQNKELRALVPGPKRKSFVWFFERLSDEGAAAPSPDKQFAVDHILQGLAKTSTEHRVDPTPTTEEEAVAGVVALGLQAKGTELSVVDQEEFWIVSVQKLDDPFWGQNGHAVRKATGEVYSWSLW